MTIRGMVLGFRLSHRRHRGSVLPRVPVQRTPQGTRVVAEVTGWKDALGFWFLATLFIGVAILVVAVTKSPSRQLEFFLSLAGSGVLVAETGRRYFRQRRLERATLLVRPWPLRLGDRATVGFENRLKKNAAVEMVSARLVCIEEAVVSSGRDQAVQREIRFEVALDTTAARTDGRTVRDEWQFEIPDTGLPSFAVKSNKIQWRVETITACAGTPVTAEFELLIIPEVAR
jgi:hypothetical protein